MTDLEKDMRDRIARLQSMLDQLDRETQRMKDFERHVRRQNRMMARQ